MPQFSLNNKEKAAILMVALGKDSSSKIYKFLNEEEIEQMTMSITGLDRFDSETQSEVLDEFLQICIAQRYVQEGGVDYAREILVSALGQEKADGLLHRISSMLQVRPFDFVRKADPAQVFNFIQNEHPQTIALVLSYLETSHASTIMTSLPIDMQVKVIKRLANMGIVAPEYVREAERVLERKLSSVGVVDNTTLGGVDTIVDILNYVDRSAERHILETLEQDDPELAEEIHMKLFTFDDISRLTNPAIQRILKDVDNDTLAMALKGATEEISSKIFGNVSKRLQEMLKENMEYMGPVRVRDVEAAQQKIVNVIRKLEDIGEIDISRAGENDIVA